MLFSLMKTKTHAIAYFLLAMLSILPANEGDIQRALFMRVLDLIVDPAPKANGQISGDETVKRLKEAISTGRQIDPAFLELVEPGLPNAFAKLMLALEYRITGLETNSVDLQMRGQKPWLDWGEYWNANDTKVYKKLKVE
jgi:hypothetical protein